jgi:hypothetical protein
MRPQHVDLPASLILLALIIGMILGAIVAQMVGG